MFENININKLITSNKLLIKYLTIILILFFVNLIFCVIIDNIETQMIVINAKYKKLKQLNSDEFILKHLLKADKNNIQNFKNYVKKYLKNNHGEIININTIDNKQLNNLIVETIQFDLTFAHDKFIFELLEIIQNYNPGFVRIIDVYVEKANKFNINQNNLKVKLLCEIYTK